ncbi:MAG TPA: hypothetical protein VGG85_09140 [Terracidiphilus sp.]|jgi:hypothetical protein
MIFGTPEVWAEGQAGAVTAATDQPKALLITILDGEGALNDVRTRTAREPIVEVDDENHKPVAGALVLFAMDNGGGSPYATFAGAQTVTVQTDAAGRAAGRGFQITQRKGRYSIKVKVTKEQLVAEAVIAESNIAVLLSNSGSDNPIPVVSHHKSIWIIGSVVAVGIVAGVVIATRGTQTTITAGSGTVGPPATASAPGIRFQLGRHHP